MKYEILTAVNLRYAGSYGSGAVYVDKAVTEEEHLYTCVESTII